MYGVYLVHPLLLIFSARVEWLHAHRWVHLTIVFFVSLAITAGMKKTPLRRFV
jgi:hypothetical protein